jgi:peroxiredoxin family protein
MDRTNPLSQALKVKPETGIYDAVMIHSQVSAVGYQVQVFSIRYGFRTCTRART